MQIRRWPLFALAGIPLVLSMVTHTSSSGLEWWITHSLEKIRPSDPEPKDAAHTVRISAARNEFEPFQVVLRSEGQEIDDVDVEVTDLRNDTSVISSEKYITVYFEHYLNLTVPSSSVGGTGEWPDALIPRVDRYTSEKRNAFPFKISKDRDQPIWIDVYVPPSTPAGTYTGQVHVDTAGKRQFNIPISLDVRNFELPSTSSLITTFGFSGNTAVRAHYGKYTTDEAIGDLTSLYQKAALWNRITLNSNAGVAPRVNLVNGAIQVRWDEYDRIIEPLMEGRIFGRDEPLYGAKATSVAISTPKVASTPEQQIAFWREVAAHFRQKGWFDRLYNYLWDEPKPVSFAAMTELGRTVHLADPALRNLVTAPLHADWSDFIDIWTPAVNCFELKPHLGGFCDPNVERASYEPEIAKGKQLWWYQACGSHGCFVVGGEYFRGWPDYMIDDAPVRNRIMEWLTWKYGIKGELYYSTDEVYSKKQQDPWKDVRLFGGNGDGTLFYPGRPDIVGGRTNIPIESIRLKLIREGLEDYEYLALLSKLGDSKTVADALNRIVRNAYDYDQDPKVLYAVRESLAQAIEKRSR